MTTNEDYSDPRNDSDASPQRGTDQHNDAEQARQAAFDAAVADTDEVPTRDEEMEQLRHTAEMADRRVLQAQAEAENFRKRMRRDFDDQLKFAAVPLITDLLQVRDNLHRAIDAAGDGSQVGGLRDGVAMVAKLLDDTMAKHGIEEVPAAGETFDPNFHEAISQMPSEVAAGLVAHVAVPGFRIHGRVIRPAQVVVSSGSA